MLSLDVWLRYGRRRMVDLTDAELDVLEALHILCDCPDPIPHCLECSSHQKRRKQDGGEMFVRHAVQLPCPTVRLIAEVRRWRDLTRHHYAGVPFMRTCAYCGRHRDEHAPVSAPGAASAPKEGVTDP